MSADRGLFLAGFAFLGLLPFAQLKLMWTLLDADTIGHVSAVSTFAVFVAALADGALSYSRHARPDESLAAAFGSVLQVRLARVVAVSPLLAVLLFALRRADEIVPVLLLTCAYTLNFAFLERNAGSVRKALRDDFLSRACCLFLPAAAAVPFGTPGIALGCLLALLLQLTMVRIWLRLRWHEFLPDFRRTLAPDLPATCLGLAYSSFVPMTATLLLAPAEFAVFNSIDRMVRAALLVAEPARLWVLRQSRVSSARLGGWSMVSLGLVLGLLACLGEFAVFTVELDRLLFGISLPFTAYPVVGFCIVFVSFTSLCLFVRQGLFRSLNVALLAGLAVGGTAFAAGLARGPYAAALAFEATVAGALLVAAAYTALRERHGQTA